MKKLLLAAGILFGIAGVQDAKAQAYTVDKDTSKGDWVPGGFFVDLKLKVRNTTSSTILVDWRVDSYDQSNGWVINSICEASDGGLCYPAGTSGLLSGANTYTAAMSAGLIANYVVSFDGDAAANFTKSWVVLSLTDGTTAKKVAFVASKGSVGGITVTAMKNDDVTIYPNPANNFIELNYSPAADVKTIAVYNLIGKPVSVYRVSDKASAHCDFPADMPSGIYLVRIADSKGNVIATRKITHQ